MENNKNNLYPKLQNGETTMNEHSGMENWKEEKKQKSKCEKFINGLKNNILLILLVVSMLLGIALGAGLRYVEPKFDNRQIMYLRFPGDLLMNMLKMLILPLIVSSLISGLSSLDTRASGRMGLRAVIYYLTTTLVAVILGIILTISIQPGSRGGPPTASGTSKVVHPADTFLDLLRQAFPSNLVEACFQKPVTEQVLREQTTTLGPSTTELGTTDVITTVSSSFNDTNGTTSQPIDVPEKIYDPKVTTAAGMNVLGLVVFSIFFGVVIGRMGERGKPLVDFFNSLSEATMVLIHLVIWYSPIGILFLVAAKVVEMEDPEKTFEQLMYYFITVMTGLIIHGFITLPMLYLVIVRRNPYKYIYGVVQALVTALGTSSSITATAAAIGAAGVPQAGLVTMVIVLTAVGFPTDDVTLVLAIDWLLDRFRTMVNVLGDAIGAGIVYHLSQKELDNMDRQDVELQKPKSGMDNEAFDGQRL